MSSVPVTLNGMLYDLYGRTTARVVFIGDASYTGLGVGGGPVIPPGGLPPGGGGPVDPGYGYPEKPVDPGYGYPIGGPPRPAHPIYMPGPHPEHPIVIPPPPDKPPEPPTQGKPPPPGGGWGFHPEYGWGYFPGTGGTPGPKT